MFALPAAAPVLLLLLGLIMHALNLMMMWVRMIAKAALGAPFVFMMTLMTMGN